MKSDIYRGANMDKAAAEFNALYETTLSKEQVMEEIDNLKRKKANGTIDDVQELIWAKIFL